MAQWEPDSVPEARNRALPLCEPHWPEAMVILGCRLVEGRPRGALQRRLLAGQHAFATLLARGTPPGLPIVMSGGKPWDGIAECQAMADWWREEQKPTAGTLIQETQSLTTQQNAACVAKLMRDYGVRRIVLVTCDFHMTRARRLFEKQNFEVHPMPAVHARPLSSKLKLTMREWGARLLQPWEPSP